MKTNKWMLALILVSLLGTLAVYSMLPPVIPTHWNASGQVDAMGSKNFVFVTGLIPLAVYFLMVFIPRIDPKKESYLKHAKAYAVTVLAITLFMIAIHWVTIFSALGYAINVGAFVRIALGVMFIVLGNYMGQIRHNYFFGIRTPWTLASEEVWRRTHRVGGYSFIFLGLLMIVSILLGGKLAFALLLGGMIGVVGYTFVYSYLLYKKLVLKK